MTKKTTTPSQPETPPPLLAATESIWMTPKVLLLGVLLLTLYRLLAVAQPYLTLFYDEAYYYHWSMNPDWGYYSKPPMVAWLITATTQLFGVSDFTVKLASPLLHSATVCWVYLIGRHLAGERAGVMAGWVFLTSTIVGFNSLFITTDAPLLFFWAASGWFFLKAMATDRWGWWIALGVATGLGMLSKYTMALLPLGLFLLMAIQPEYRARLATLKPWTAAVLAGLVFSPNILWNLNHGLVTLNHTSDIAQLDGPLFHPGQLAEFLAGQLLVIGPFWSWIFLRRLFSKPSQTTSTDYLPFILATFVPLMAVIASQALLSRAFVNWAAPCLIAASVWVGIQLAFHRPHFLTLGVMGQLIILSLIYHWPTIMDSLGVERGKRNDPYQRILAWPDLAQKVQPWIERYPAARLTSSHRDLIAYVGFYADADRLFVARWDSNTDHVDDYYDQNFNLDRYQNLPQQEFLLMQKTPATDQMLKSFSNCDFLELVRVPVYPTLHREAFLYHCRGFEGYDTEE